MHRTKNKTKAVHQFLGDELMKSHQKPLYIRSREAGSLCPLRRMPVPSISVTASHMYR